MAWQLIESDDALAGLLEGAAGSTAVAVDTEFMRRNTFYPQVALLQLCFDDQAWLIDPLAITETGPLIDLMENSAIVKVLHSASEDLEVFQQWLGVLPQPLFDTQRAAALLDRGFGVGYRSLVLEICGVDLAKGETRSDWLRRPLTESQCEYAAQDVIHLLSAWRSLDEECNQQGKRDWVFSDSQIAAGSLATAAGQFHKRIKSGWKLNARQQQALVAVCDWREQMARHKDKPRNWIIDDKACLGLAQMKSTTWNEMKALDLLSASALRHYGSELVALLERQPDLDGIETPQLLPRPLDSGQRNQVKQLKQTAKKIAASLGVAPEALLQAKDYEALVREASGEQVTEPRQWQGWRGELVVSPLRRALSGEGT
ncbi:MAG: ribonuclease D [Halieaceae bacterium]|nr:ribonuclease D [Halieaceae bacterium]